MLLQYASDLHLEFLDNEYLIRNQPIVPQADILILAGDIVPFWQMVKYNWFFDYLSDNFKAVYWVPGNHEYYHYDIANKRGSFHDPIRDNVFLVNDHAMTIEDTRLIFATLWTSIRQRGQIAIEKGMNDFHLIRKNGDRLTAEDLKLEHETSLAFIEYELLQENALKKVVVTHHVPTFINYPEQYLGSVLNEAFAVELKQLIRQCGPDYWIYGHHHQNIPGFQLGPTKLVTNQMGYVRYSENIGFDASKTIDTNPRQQFIIR